MIPEAAVVAATKVLFADNISNHAGDNAPQIIAACESVARAALEAAAPHMLAPVLALADEMDNVHGSIRGHVTTYQLRQALGVPRA